MSKFVSRFSKQLISFYFFSFIFHQHPYTEKRSNIVHVLNGKLDRSRDNNFESRSIHFIPTTTTTTINTIIDCLNSIRPSNRSALNTNRFDHQQSNYISPLHNQQYRTQSTSIKTEISKTFPKQFDYSWSEQFIRPTSHPYQSCSSSSSSTDFNFYPTNRFASDHSFIPSFSSSLNSQQVNSCATISDKMPHMSSTSSSSSSAPSAVSHQYHPHHQQQREHHTNHYGHPNQQPTHLNSNSKPVKIKRTRQRVDAGEPRNSYASIANFSSRGGYHGHHNKHGGSNSNSNNNSNQSNNYHHNQSSNNNHGISNSSNTNSNGINHPHSLERSHSIGSWPSNHGNYYSLGFHQTRNLMNSVSIHS